MEKNIYAKRYELLKRKMNESTKGFWRVKSLCILNRNLNKKYNPKEASMKKKIERIVPKLPNFIKIKPIQILFKKQKKENQNSKKELFITSQYNKIKNQKENKEKFSTTYNELFGKFPYEPFIYNEYYLKVFPHYKKNQRTLNECVKDSRNLSVILKKKFLLKSFSQKNYNNHDIDNKLYFTNSHFSKNKKDKSSLTVYDNFLKNLNSIKKKLYSNSVDIDFSSSDVNSTNKKNSEFSFINSKY